MKGRYLLVLIWGRGAFVLGIYFRSILGGLLSRELMSAPLSIERACLLSSAYCAIFNRTVDGSGTLCGIHTYVGADDMWDSCRRARYFPSSRHRQHTYSSPFLRLIDTRYPISGFTFAFIDDDSRV